MFAPLIASAVLLTTGPQVALHPAVVPLRHTASVTVTGVAAPTLQVHLLGGSTALGKALPWTTLRRVGKTWHGTLPLPEFRGIYPIELRVARGAQVLRSDHWLLRVFARGTLSRPSFKTPEEVAAYWVSTVGSKARIQALKRWPRPAFDRRDRRLHQLMVIAYSPDAKTKVRDRLGIFVTAVRDGYHGRWRLLEATAVP
ncbi:MAG TPA: hypothetical protein VEG24_04875 [Gaiellaceae bacterium]|nr:hypothetical protein [Gaiellaceae bacterium]